MHTPLPREFYDRDTAEVARALLGCLLYRQIEGRLYAARVVETEAYVGTHDLACHASKGITQRTQVMFGPPGHAYVYFIYGLHHLLNAVTEGEGHGSAVLFRALEPVSGFSEACKTDGPAKLTRILGIDKEWNRWDLTSGEGLWLGRPDRVVGPISKGPRVGVDYAGAWANEHLRYWLEGNPWVSGRPRTSRRDMVQGGPTRRLRKGP